MAGDRRATEGYYIADSRMDKVFPADEYSVVGIAGVAGQAIEQVRLFQVELEHYEKVEGEITLPGGQGQSARAASPRLVPLDHAGTRRGAHLRRLRHRAG